MAIKQPPPPPLLETAVVRVNVAVTFCIAFIVTLQSPSPVQLPDHPEKELLESGVAVSVIDAPLAYS